MREYLYNVKECEAVGKYAICKNLITHKWKENPSTTNCLSCIVLSGALYLFYLESNCI